jgi:hypothetical protein
MQTNSDPRSETGKILPSESCHYYWPDGRPCYEVEAKKGGMRATTITDARKLGLVPSVTTIIGIMAKPGLQKWKLQQMLHAALTLPRLAGESDDSFAERVISDSEEQGRKAMDRGTQLHAAIEEYINGQSSLLWQDHLGKLYDTLHQMDIHLYHGKAEHSFASPLGYGGKLDWHSNEIVIDFKTKDRIDDKKQLAWPEYCWQLAAYQQGLGNLRGAQRLINVFIGVEDKQVRVVEWTPEDAEQGWKVFEHLLAVWKITKKYNP